MSQRGVTDCCDCSGFVMLQRPDIDCEWQRVGHTGDAAEAAHWVHVTELGTADHNVLNRTIVTTLRDPAI